MNVMIPEPLGSRGEPQGSALRSEDEETSLVFEFFETSRAANQLLSSLLWRLDYSNSPLRLKDEETSFYLWALQNLSSRQPGRLTNRESLNLYRRDDNNWLDCSIYWCCLLLLLLLLRSTYSHEEVSRKDYKQTVNNNQETCWALYSSQSYMLVTLYKVNKKIDLCKRNRTKIYNTRTHVRDGRISVRKYYWEENSTVYEQHGEKA